MEGADVLNEEQKSGVDHCRKVIDVADNFDEKICTPFFSDHDSLDKVQLSKNLVGLDLDALIAMGFEPIEPDPLTFRDNFSLRDNFPASEESISRIRCREGDFSVGQQRGKEDFDEIKFIRDALCLDEEILERPSVENYFDHGKNLELVENHTSLENPETEGHWKNPVLGENQEICEQSANQVCMIDSLADTPPVGEWELGGGVGGHVRGAEGVGMREEMARKLDYLRHDSYEVRTWLKIFCGGGV